MRERLRGVLGNIFIAIGTGGVSILEGGVIERESKQDNQHKSPGK